MKNMKVNAIVYQEVYIDPVDALACVKNALGFREDHDSFVGIKDGELVHGEDVSYHGSPMYKYETISNNPKWLELYNSVRCLDDYFGHSKEPQWDRIINHGETDEENISIKGM